MSDRVRLPDDESGPDGWDGERPEPPIDEVSWSGVLGLLDAVAEQRQAPPRPPPEPRVTADGVRILDLAGTPSPAARALAAQVQTDLMSSGFAWTDFVRSPRGRLLLERLGEGRAGDVTLDECRMLLIALVRQERFVSGALDGAIRRGLVEVLLRRVAVLVGR